MGEQIRSAAFADEDFTAFRARLAEQVAALSALVARPGFGAGAPSIGVEVELSLVDTMARPADCNTEVAAAVVGRGVSVELNRFAGEYDSEPVPLAGRPFEALAADLRGGLGAVAAAAAGFHARVALVGTLPTLTRRDLLDPDVMTPKERYKALAAALAASKSDDDIRIDGPERLRTTIPGIVAEGANNALQVHLRVPPADFARTLDAAHLVSAPVLALAANSPFFLQRRLWDDTRIPLFTQAVCGAGAPSRAHRVFLAHGWSSGGAAGAFAEDVARFPPILPVLFDADPAADPPALHELRLHAGSIWRWNRPVYDPTDGGHVRIEFRALPTGPTVADMIGNAALIVGAALALADTDVAAALPFPLARANLDAAARDGLDCTLDWPHPDGGPPVRRGVRDILTDLLPAADSALVAAGVEPQDARVALEAVEQRLAADRSAARWQVATTARLEPTLGRAAALTRMLQQLLEYGYDGPPIAQWRA